MAMIPPSLPGSLSVFVNGPGYANVSFIRSLVQIFSSDTRGNRWSSLFLYLLLVWDKWWGFVGKKLSLVAKWVVKWVVKAWDLVKTATNKVTAVAMFLKNQTISGFVWLLERWLGYIEEVFEKFNNPSHPITAPKVKWNCLLKLFYFSTLCISVNGLFITIANLVILENAFNQRISILLYILILLVNVALAVVVLLDKNPSTFWARFRGDKFLCVSGLKTIGYYFAFYFLWANYEDTRVSLPCFWSILGISSIAIVGANFDKYKLLNEFIEMLILPFFVEIFKEPTFRFIEPIIKEALDSPEFFDEVHKSERLEFIDRLFFRIESKLAVVPLFVFMWALPIFFGLLVKYLPVIAIEAEEGQEENLNAIVGNVEEEGQEENLNAAGGNAGHGAVGNARQEEIVNAAVGNAGHEALVIAIEEEEEAQQENLNAGQGEAFSISCL